MDNPEQSHGKPIKKISGEFVDIHLVAPEEWTEFFENPPAHRRIFQGGAGELPSPIHETTVDYWNNTADDMIGMTAVVEFHPNAIVDEVKTTWQSNILDELLERIHEQNFAVHILPHETAAFNVILSPEYTARIQTSTDVHQCIVSINLIWTNEVESALDVKFDDKILPSQQHDLEEIFRNFLTLWSHTINAVALEYGEDKTHKHSARPQHPTLIISPHEDTPGSSLVPIEPTILAMPLAEMMSENKVSFDDIAGYDDIKEKLRDLALIQKHPELAADIGLNSTHGILLYGVPGTGKTTLLKAYATEIGAELMELSVSQIIKKWVGDSARNLDQYFEELKLKTEKVVLLMDEFDALGVSDQHSSSGERTDTVNRLKEHIVTINDNHHNIIMVGATNNIHRVDEALTRPGRFLPIEVHEPNERMRRDIWSLILGKAAAKAAFLDIEKPHSVSLHVAADVDTAQLAEVSNGMVGAHFTEIMNTIRRQRLRMFEQTGVMTPITQADLLKEIKAIDLEP